MGCLGECWDLGPPPDSILFLPPPPVPSFLQSPLQDLVLNSTPCSTSQICEPWVASNRVPEGDYVELPRKGKLTPCPSFSSARFKWKPSLQLPCYIAIMEFIITTVTAKITCAELMCRLGMY